MPDIHTFYATVAMGIEPLLTTELEELGVTVIKTAQGSVEFSASLEDAYRVCLWSRLANRVLLPLSQFPAETPEALYEGVSAINWQEHFDYENTFAVDANVSRSKINHSHYAALQVKDAIVDQFVEKSEQRPSVDIKNADIRINLYINRDEAQLALDLSGGSLHQRGYRLQGAAAPLKENLAAAILLRANWPEIAKKGGAFCDFMCGSGTLLIEAAYIAADIAPGIMRKHFGFLYWKHFDITVWNKLLAEAETRKQNGLQNCPRILGFDISYKAFQIATENIAHAGLDSVIHVEKQNFNQIDINKKLTPGLVCTNAPYGKRIGEIEELGPLYQEIGVKLKSDFDGWQAAVFTANPDLGKRIGIHSHKQYALFNGPLPCKLILFDVTRDNFITPKRLPRLLKSEDISENGNMFRNRLKKNLKQLGKWLRQNDIHCYRAYDADMPEYAVAIDVFVADKTWIHVQEYEAPKEIEVKAAMQRLREALSVIRDVFEIPEEQLFLKQRRQQKGLGQYQKQAESKDFHVVEENGLKFKVNFEDYLDTGLFLDHRIVRQWISENSKGADFLNLFAYTGSASVYAAAGGADTTTTIDMSRPYLDWAKDNMKLNGFSSAAHEFIQEDCVEWLRKQKQEAQFDLIFIDPPSFSNSKRMKDVFDVQQDHVPMILKAMTLLKPDGLLIFSNNLRSFKMNREELNEFDLKDVSRASIPRDFERNQRIHQCWEIRFK